MSDEKGLEDSENHPIPGDYKLLNQASIATKWIPLCGRHPTIMWTSTGAGAFMMMMNMFNSFEDPL